MACLTIGEKVEPDHVRIASQFDANRVDVDVGHVDLVRLTSGRETLDRVVASKVQLADDKDVAACAAPHGVISGTTAKDVITVAAVELVSSDLSRRPRLFEDHQDIFLRSRRSRKNAPCFEEAS